MIVADIVAVAVIFLLGVVYQQKWDARQFRKRQAQGRDTCRFCEHRHDPR